MALPGDGAHSVSCCRIERHSIGSHSIDIHSSRTYRSDAASVGTTPAEVLEATGKNISELATANIAALAGYNITAADVTALDNLTTAFHGAKTEPRAAVVDRKKQTDTLPGAIADVRSILRNRLDKQMTTYRRTNGEFYAGYLAARVIVDRGGGGGKKPAPPAPPQ